MLTVWEKNTKKSRILLTIHRIINYCRGYLICRGCINRLYHTSLNKADVLTTSEVDILYLLP